MIVRKLRLQRGWSQDHLASITGLSVRTIQRIEAGHPPSLESANALASVFEVELSTFQAEEHLMENQVSSTKTNLSPQDVAAMLYAKRVKSFYEGLIAYAILLPLFFTMLGFNEPVLYVAFLGAGLGLILQGLFAFEIIRIPFANWERKMVEKKLGHKL